MRLAWSELNNGIVHAGCLTTTTMKEISIAPPDGALSAQKVLGPFMGDKVGHWASDVASRDWPGDVTSFAIFLNHFQNS